MKENKKLQGIIFNIQKFSTDDGPGIRTNVFLKGCPLSCYWCSNPESQKSAAQVLWDKELCVGCLCCGGKKEGKTLIFDNAEPRLEQLCQSAAITVAGKKYSTDEVFEIIMQDKVFYDGTGGGVTLSGGEPLMQSEFAGELLKMCKSAGLYTAMETTGYASEDTFNKLMPYVDLYLFDFKHPNDEIHKKATGVGNQIILKNLKSLKKVGKEVLVRIPVIPDFNDSLETAERYGNVLTDIGIKKVQLLPFHQFGEKKYELLNREYRLKGVKSLKNEDLEEFKAVLEKWEIEVKQ